MGERMIFVGHVTKCLVTPDVYSYACSQPLAEKARRASQVLVPIANIHMHILLGFGFHPFYLSLSTGISEIVASLSFGIFSDLDVLELYNV
jgi:hypothetical protein